KTARPRQRGDCVRVKEGPDLLSPARYFMSGSRPTARLRGTGHSRSRFRSASWEDDMGPRHRLGGLVSAAVFAILATSPASVGAATALPLHVYAPYFETWTTDSLTTIAQQSGARYVTLAFLETTSKTSCTLAWDGVKTDTVGSGRYLSDIASLRAIGGDVIPSFGGWSADQGGTEIGDSCSDVNTIATAFESVITTYDVSRLDMDIEGRSLTRTD